MKIIIGADEAGFALKETVCKYLENKDMCVYDLTKTNDKPYYETAQLAAKAIQNGEYDYGILICGTGMGMSIVANRFKGVYASCVESAYAAKKCRIINNANILCMGGFIIGKQMGIDMVEAFLNTEFCEGTDKGLEDFLKQAYTCISKI